MTKSTSISQTTLLSATPSMANNQDTSTTSPSGLFSSPSRDSRREMLSRILTEALELSEQCSINHDTTHQEEQAPSGVSRAFGTPKKDDDKVPPRQ